ncbi:hypothetical protein GH714_040406 [Hevea brasiliensis]|uniref:Uncharacterized protein n=1 Tax=Hevea brasiliensis TaxID=3981 RepID=A0A6A6N7H4_HEVBR|nr:hypothetical protein GH714_040406 [Hevea brasiliensis]
MFAGVDFRGKQANRASRRVAGEEQAKMRLSLPTACQNEVQRGWRRAGRLLGKPGDGRPKMRGVELYIVPTALAPPQALRMGLVWLPSKLNFMLCDLKTPYFSISLDIREPN